MTDDEYLFDLVFTKTSNSLLVNLATAFKTKFLNNKEKKDIILDYAILSYIEPNSSPNRTPIEKIPDLILSETSFIHAFLNRLAENNKLELVIPELTGIIFRNINIIPDESIQVYYYQLYQLFTNTQVRIYYINNEFKYFELLFNPRLCPDMYNILVLPQNKEIILGLSKHFGTFHIKISEILLLFCKCKHSRPKMISYLYAYVDRNKGRKKTIRDLDCNFDGEVINFLGSMFHLCQPFLSIHSDKVTKINTCDSQSNFISQCFDLTSKMIDYGFLTTLEHFTRTQSQHEHTQNEYLNVCTQSQLLNLDFLNNLKKFLLLQLHVINLHQLTDEQLIESIWNTLESLIHLRLVDFEIIKYTTQYYCQNEDKFTNYHLKCELGRITSMCLNLNIILPEKEIMNKLIFLYGNLPNVDTFHQFMCRKEISQCLQYFDITTLEKSTLTNFGYALLSELDTLSSKALDNLIEIKIKVDEQQQLEKEEIHNLKINFDSTNEILCLLKKMTQVIPESFRDECTIQKSASAWSFLIYRLIGPQSLKLKITNPGSYHFYPKKILSNCIYILKNLKNESFLIQVGKVGLLNSNILNKLIRILEREKIVTNSEIQELKQILSEIDIKIEQDDAPDEFYDPIMGNLMSDPVRLPSGNIVDRTTILQHLKNDTSDPFTRQEMTENDLVIEEELKVKIQDYLQN